MIFAKDDQICILIAGYGSGCLGSLQRGILKAAQAALRDPNLSEDEKDGLIYLLEIAAELALNEQQAERALQAVAA